DEGREGDRQRRAEQQRLHRWSPSGARRHVQQWYAEHDGCDERQEIGQQIGEIAAARIEATQASGVLRSDADEWEEALQQRGAVHRIDLEARYGSTAEQTAICMRELVHGDV